MAKTYVRVDDRLIHGQTIVAWAPTLQIGEIIGIDDVSAANPMLKSILTMGVPKQYITHIVTTAEAMELLATEGEKNRLVIVKTAHKLTEIKDAIRGCECIYLGNLAKRDDTTHQMTGATGIYFFSDKDVEELNVLTVEGFDITFQQLPGAVPKSWESFAKTV